MTERAISAALAVFSLLHVAVMTVPAAVVAVAADKGGLPDAHGLDLVAVSVLLGGAHAGIVWRRLRDELRRGVAFASALIAEYNALVVLALMATGLLIVVLGGLAPEHSAMVNKGWPVVGLWGAVLLGAIVAAEVSRTLVLRWLCRADDERREIGESLRSAPGG